MSSDPVAKVASDGIYIILNELPDLLNSKSHAIIKVGHGSHDIYMMTSLLHHQLMYRQQFFIETVPLLVEQLNDPQNGNIHYITGVCNLCPVAYKQYYLRALSHVMQAVPKQVLLGELPSVRNYNQRIVI